MRIVKKLAKTFVLAMLILSVFFTPSNVQAKANYKEGALLKIKDARGAAVYKIGDDGKKYVYPDQKTFETWHDNFNEVVEVEQEDLDDIDDGGTVPFQAGTKLITHPNTAKVYAVGNEGQLTYIPDENVATKYYGEKWTDLVTDVDPGLFAISYRVKKGVLSDDNLPDGSLVEEENTGEVYLIEDGQRRKVEEEALRLRELIKKYTIRLKELENVYEVGDEYDDYATFKPSGTITFEDITAELPRYNVYTQHALKSFKGISWDNDGTAGGTGWGVYSTSNSQAHSGSNYVLNRHGINFLGFTFPQVVNFKGAYFAKAVTNAGMSIDDPKGYSAAKLRYHFYDENLELIGTSDWFDLQATSKLFPADINVKRVVIEHDTLNATTGGFNTPDAEWYSMDDVMYEAVGSDDPDPVDKLDIKLIDIITIPASPVAYATTTIKGRIKNTGSVALTDEAGVINSSGTFEDFYVFYPGIPTLSNPHGISTADPLNPGEAIDVIWTGRFQSTGEKTLSVTADATNILDEADETNNTRSENVTVLGRLPDLKVSNISIYPNNPIPVVNASTTIAGYVQNRGASSLTEMFDYTKSLQDFVLTGTTEPVVSSTDPFGQNETVWFYWEGYFTSAGKKSLTLTVDPLDEISEQDETNNTYTKEVLVISEIDDDIFPNEPLVFGVKTYPDGTLLRGPDHKIYIINKGIKKHITTLEELFDYAGQEIIDVDYEVLAQY